MKVEEQQGKGEGKRNTGIGQEEIEARKGRRERSV